MRLKSIQLIHVAFLASPVLLLGIVFMFHTQAVPVENASLGQLNLLANFAAFLLFAAELGGTVAFRTLRGTRSPMRAQITRMALLEAPALLAVATLFLYTVQVGPLAAAKPVKVSAAVLLGYVILWVLHFPKAKRFPGIEFEDVS
jgi:small-conductance mechanosensitive channel